MPILACAAADRDAFPRVSEWIEQRGRSFGDRLACSVSEAFARGFSTVLVTGIDTPPPSDLAPVFTILERGAAPAVIAPARDGGVNLIGLREPALHLLRDIDAGQRDVAARFQREFPDLVTLDMQSDIDSPADVARASVERDWIPFRSLVLACVPRVRSTVVPRNSPAGALAVSVSRAPPAAF